MARFSRRTTFRRRVRRNWQWARMTSNDTAVIASPGHYTEDLLSTFKSEYGFSVNFPDITIWRVRLRISVNIRFVAAPVNFESIGFIMGMFVDDPAFTLLGVETKPYMEKYMYYGATFYEEFVEQGAPQVTASGSQFMNKEYDIKARRRLGNIEDTLLMQVGTTGAGTASLGGLAWTSSTLLSLGRR